MMTNNGKKNGSKMGAKWEKLEKNGRKMGHFG
jgi:hypothetical protein